MELSVRRKSNAENMEVFFVIRDVGGSGVGAAIVAERLCVAIAGAPTHLQSVDIPVTVSIGVDVRSPQTRSPEALLKAADEDMYRAKMKQRRRGTHRTRSREPVAAESLVHV